MGSRVIVAGVVLLAVVTCTIAQDRPTAQEAAIIPLKHVRADRVVRLFGGPEGEARRAEAPPGRVEFLGTARERATEGVEASPDQMSEPGIYPLPARLILEVRAAPAWWAPAPEGEPATGIASLLPDGLSEKPVAFLDDNSLIVRGTPEAVDQVREIIALLDKPARTVRVAVSLVSLGVGGLPFEATEPGPDPGGLGVGVISHRGPASAGVKGQSDSSEIILPSNTPCVIRAVVAIPFVEATRGGEAGALEYRVEAAVQAVEVVAIPRINADDSVTLLLYQAPIDPGATPAPIRTYGKVEHGVTALEGDTVVLGGLPGAWEALEQLGQPVRWAGAEAADGADVLLFIAPRLVEE